MRVSCDSATAAVLPVLACIRARALSCVARRQCFRHAQAAALVTRRRPLGTRGSLVALRHGLVALTRTPSLRWGVGWGALGRWGIRSAGASVSLGRRHLSLAAWGMRSCAGCPFFSGTRPVKGTRTFGLRAACTRTLASSHSGIPWARHALLGAYVYLVEQRTCAFGQRTRLSGGHGVLLEGTEYCWRARRAFWRARRVFFCCLRIASLCTASFDGHSVLSNTVS